MRQGYSTVRLGLEMKRFNIFFTLRGPGGTLEVPNKFNPVECANMASLLRQLMDNLPSGLVETVGVRVVELS